MSKLTPTQVYAQWVASADNDWPQAALISAHRELIDTVAVMIPGAVEPATRIALQSVQLWSGQQAIKSAYVTGLDNKLPAPWAALVNGTAGHALDYDDNFDPPKAHASTVLYPAILALADAEQSSGAQVLDAYIVGLQIMGRIGQGVNPTHRDRGWHATATVGVFGAAAACARLLRLNAAQCTHALSLASSMASGFMSQFGTMTKPLHAGLAAMRGIMAATLAQQGMQAGLHTLDGKHGMNTLMVGPDREQLKAELNGAEHGQTLSFNLEPVGEPLLITHHGYRVKRFPNCGSAHRAMDLLQDLMQQQQLSGDQIQRIEVHAPAANLNNLFYHRPATGLQAKFSMQYALACLLETGQARLDDFTDSAVHRSSVLRHCDKIELHPIAALESITPTVLIAHGYDGRSWRSQTMLPKGSIGAPFPTSQYWDKFNECSSGHLDADHQQALRQALQSFAQLPHSSDMSRYFASISSKPES